VCYNGGSLNLNSCECACPKLFTGSLCETSKLASLVLVQ
jgi:hypothetical protein